MSNFKVIEEKLEQFMRRFYTNELLKGVILFFSIGLLYLLLTLFIEYILWLGTTARTILFWLFILVEMGLFIKFIAFPLMRLFKLQKGIGYDEAAKIIGNHFPEVNDKLLNVIQLKADGRASELLLASIEQKSHELTPVPFKLAINLNQNTKYLKYAAIPIVIILLSYLTGKINWFSDSYQRVVNYQTAYEPPAPFQFFVVNDSLHAIENKDFKLQIKTAGDVIPDHAKIHFNGESYFLNQLTAGDFEYVFNKPKSDIEFYFTSGEVTSKSYILTMTHIPNLLDFEMVLDYPSYTNRKDEIIKSTGNASVPQGTTVTWKLQTKFTDEVLILSEDTLSLEKIEDDFFQAQKQLFDKYAYGISVSNQALRDYERLSFNIEVVKDEYPELKLQMVRDSLDNKTMYFQGQASDDYGLRNLQMVYYPEGNEAEKHIKSITIHDTHVSDFITAFPNQLDLEEGVNYQVFFQVFDNDAIHQFKSTKSAVFSYRKSTKEEEEQEQLQQQSETIKQLDNSLEKFDDRQKELDALSKTQKEKKELNFNDKRQLENFLKRQKQQEEMMKSFNEKLTENLEEFQKDHEKTDSFKEDLKERLKDNEEQLKQDEKLLEELQKLQEKIDKESLSEKLDQLAKQNKNQKRSLEQLLELTKKYYINKKMERLQQDLDKLADDQLKLSEETQQENTKQAQDSLNKKFDDFQKDMEELKKENEGLIEPMKLPNNEKSEDDIKKDQQEASEELENQEQNSSQGNQQQAQQNSQNASKKQKQAGQKMKQMSQQMQESMSMMGGSGEQMMEDIEMLRQILDNLLLFSFDQERLMNQFKSIQTNHNKYAQYLRQQQSLKEHFSHVDDSLFALSLRQPKISEFVNQQISDVFFNIDKSMDQFSENRIYQGVAAQQYTITASNNLADYLSNMLNNMQMQMNAQGQGQGQGQGKQGQGQEGQSLPDIIMSQEQLNEMMKNGIQQGQKQGEQNEGKNGKEGQGGGNSKNGNDGKNSKEGEGQMNEEMNGELFKIYQEQAQIRQQLEDRLRQEGMDPNGNNLVKEMENVELDLLNKGFTQQTLEKMLRLQHQLLKMENATFKQGKDNKRESESNQENFKNNSNDVIPQAKEYFNNNEILNRQSLPLQPSYNHKVKQYFNRISND